MGNLYFFMLVGIDSSLAILQDIEEDLRRLKQEITQIRTMYNMACQEALTAREKVNSDTGRKYTFLDANEVISQLNQLL